MSSPVNKKSKPCCVLNGDVRGMCFTCIGGLPKMTADAILRVRRCPNTPYAIAFWIFNNHHDKYEADKEFWLKGELAPYLQLITEGSSAMIEAISDQLYFQVHVPYCRCRDEEAVAKCVIDGEFVYLCSGCLHERQMREEEATQGFQ